MVERYQAILAAEAAELKKRLPEGKLADMFERCYLNTIDPPHAVRTIPEARTAANTSAIFFMLLSLHIFSLCLSVTDSADYSIPYI